MQHCTGVATFTGDGMLIANLGIFGVKGSNVFMWVGATCSGGGEGLRKPSHSQEPPGSDRVLQVVGGALA